MPFPCVTCTVHPANRAHRAGHVGSHTRAHVKNPSVPNSLPSLTFVRPRDQLLTACVSGPGLTLVTVLAGVSSVARHGQPVHYRADPGRSRLQLPPLPGIWPAAVVVAIHASHTGVSRRPDCTQSNYHSYSHRETQPHAPAWRPTSPVCTATSHTRSLSHTVGHSHTPHHSHPRGHSPAVSHTPVGVRTHVPLPAGV